MLFRSVLINVYLGIYIDSEVLKKNCFPYETAFENFRDEEVSEEVINSFLYDSEPMEENAITEQKIKSISYCFTYLRSVLMTFQENLDVIGEIGKGIHFPSTFAASEAEGTVK